MIIELIIDNKIIIINLVGIILASYDIVNYTTSNLKFFNLVNLVLIRINSRVMANDKVLSILLVKRKPKVKPIYLV